MCILIKYVMNMLYYCQLKLKGKIYATPLLHISETWPMRVEHELKLNRTEMSRTRCMCGVKLNERKKSEELRELFKFDDQKE